MSDEPFDFVRYFTRVQQTPSWFGMMLGLAQFAGIQPYQELTILDVGCGPGRLVNFLKNAGNHPIGADNDLCMVEKAKSSYPNAEFVTGSANQLPFPTNSFDAVISANLLFFLPNPLATLQEMGRVVKSGGIVAVWNPAEKMSVPAMEAYVVRHQTELDDFEQKHLPNWANVAESNRRWDEDELEKLFVNAGMNDFASQLILGDLARYGRGTVTKRS